MSDMKSARKMAMSKIGGQKTPKKWAVPTKQKSGHVTDFWWAIGVKKLVEPTKMAGVTVMSLECHKDSVTVIDDIIRVGGNNLITFAVVGWIWITCQGQYHLSVVVV